MSDYLIRINFFFLIGKRRRPRRGVAVTVAHRRSPQPSRSCKNIVHAYTIHNMACVSVGKKWAAPFCFGFRQSRRTSFPRFGQLHFFLRARSARAAHRLHSQKKIALNPRATDTRRMCVNNNFTANARRVNRAITSRACNTYPFNPSGWVSRMRFSPLRSPSAPCGFSGRKKVSIGGIVKHLFRHSNPTPVIE